MSARRPRPTGRRSSREAERDEDAILSEQRHGVGHGRDGEHLQKGGQNLCAGAIARSQRFEQCLGELERHSGSAKMRTGVAAFGLVGVEDGESFGNDPRLVSGKWWSVTMRSRPSSARGVGGGEGADAGVDADDEANAFAPRLSRISRCMP